MKLTMDQILELLVDANTLLDESIKRVKETIKEKDKPEREIDRTKVDKEKIEEAKTMIGDILQGIDDVELSAKDVEILKASLIKLSVVVKRDASNEIVKKIKSDRTFEEIMTNMQPTIEKLTSMDKIIKEYSQREYDIKDHKEYEKKKIEKLQQENKENEEKLKEADDLFDGLFEAYELEESRNEILVNIQSECENLKEIIDEISNGSLSMEERKTKEKEKEDLIGKIKGLQKQYRDVEKLIVIQTGSSSIKKAELDGENPFEMDPLKLANSDNFDWLKDLQEDCRNRKDNIQTKFKAKMEEFEKNADESEEIKKFRDDFGIASYDDFKKIGDIRYILKGAKMEEIKKEIEENNKKIEAIKETVKKLEEIERDSKIEKSVEKKSSAGNSNKKENKKKNKQKSKVKFDESKLPEQDKKEIDRLFEELFKGLNNENNLLVVYDDKKKMDKDTKKQLKKALENTVYKGKRFAKIRAAFGVLSSKGQKKALEAVKSAYREQAQKEYKKDKINKNRKKANAMAEKYKVEGVQEIIKSNKSAEEVRENMYENFDRDL